MTARIQPRIVVATLAILVVTVYLAGLRASTATMAKLSRAHGRYTSQEIVAHSKAPAFELFGDSANWQLSAYSDLAPDGRGGQIHVWNVVCTDPAGKYLGHFGWNGDSGDLMRYCDRTRICDPRSQGPLTDAEAVSEAKKWLRELTFNRKTSDWKLVARPARRLNLWVVQFAGRTGAADLKIDVRSGKLLMYHLLSA